METYVEDQTKIKYRKENEELVKQAINLYEQIDLFNWQEQKCSKYGFIFDENVFKYSKEKADKVLNNAFETEEAIIVKHQFVPSNSITQLFDEEMCSSLNIFDSYSYIKARNPLIIDSRDKIPSVTKSKFEQALNLNGRLSTNNVTKKVCSEYGFWKGDSEYDKYSKIQMINTLNVIEQSSTKNEMSEFYAMILAMETKLENKLRSENIQKLKQFCYNTSERTKKNIKIFKTLYPDL